MIGNVSHELYDRLVNALDSLPPEPERHSAANWQILAVLEDFDWSHLSVRPPNLVQRLRQTVDEVVGEHWPRMPSRAIAALIIRRLGAVGLLPGSFNAVYGPDLTAERLNRALTDQTPVSLTVFGDDFDVSDLTSVVRFKAWYGGWICETTDHRWFRLHTGSQTGLADGWGICFLTGEPAQWAQ